jgi:cytochrome P450
LKITYGYTAEPKGKDYLVDMAVRTMHEFSESTIPGKWPVDIMPFCEYHRLYHVTSLINTVQYLPDWMPGTGFKRTAREMAAQLQKTTEQPYAFVKQQMREKKHKTSFLSQAIENIGSDADMERIHKWSASSMYLGGADTTVSALMTFFLAMTLFPDVQKRAQAELDSVMGDSLPMSSDRERLPYIWAVVQETHRWHPVAPMAIPHASTKEDVIRGYRIPKGALILPNNWWFTHDPAVYPDPMSFRPERFIDTPTHKAEPDPRTWTFGYGRRVCPGRYVADNALFITIAQSLAVFKIEKLVENGKVVEPEMKFEPGVVSHPVPYRTSIVPRSEKHRERIRQAEKEYPWQESDVEAMKTVKW